MSEHTSGEWKLSGIIVYAEGSGVVCQLSEPRASKFIQHQPLGYGSPDRVEAMANGQLIAAVPHLLEALGILTDEADKMQRLLIEITPILYREELKGYLPYGLMDKVQAWLGSAAPDRAIEQARAAVARARGRSE